VVLALGSDPGSNSVRFAGALPLRRMAQVGAAGFDPARARIMPEVRFHARLSTS